MENIAANYRSLHQLAEVALNNSKGKDENLINQAWGAIQQWRSIVYSTVDSITAAGFDSIPKQTIAPLSWPIGGIASSCYSEFKKMEAQMNWLVDRHSKGQININVHGSNNQVVSSAGNISGNISNAPNAQDSNIQQGIDSVQSQGSTEDLKRFVGLIRENINDLNLSEHDVTKLNSQIDTIDSQLKSEPNPVIIKEAGKTIRSLIEGTVGGLIATAAQPSVWEFVRNILNSF